MAEGIAGEFDSGLLLEDYLNDCLKIEKAGISGLADGLPRGID